MFCHAALPRGDKVLGATVGLEYTSPQVRHAEQVVVGGQFEVLGFNQHPGDGRGVAQVDG